MISPSRPKALAASVVVLITLLIVGCGDDSESPDPPRLNVTPTAIERDVGITETGTPDPQGQYVVVRNGGEGVLTYSAHLADGAWLRLHLQVSGQAPDSFLVDFNVVSLEAGIFYDTVWVESPTAINSPLALPVTLTLANQILTSLDTVVFQSVSGSSNPDPQQLIISGTSSAPLDFTLTETATWLTLSATTGTTPDTIELAADIQPLEPGEYIDSIVIAAPMATGPKTIPCRLTVASWLPIGGLSYSLRAVHFLNAQTGFTVGVLSGGELSGIIYRTENGGSDWDSYIVDDIPLGDVDFAGEILGWTVGQLGRVMQTSNRGDSWSTQPTPTSTTLNAVSFANSELGLAAGNGGVIIRTNDGASWQTQTSGTTSDLKGVCFVDATHAWAVGNFGSILLSGDSGKTWQTRHVVGLEADLYDVTFADASHGWIVGEEGALLRTANGGLSWTFEAVPTTETLQAVTFVSSTRGWAVGTGGIILFTDDGHNWSPQPSGVTTGLEDVFFIDENIGWICGDHGVLLHTTGGGL